MLPPIYIDAGVRGTTPFCPQRNRMGVSIDVAGQGTVHFAIDRDHASFLRVCLDDYINSFAGSQSEESELSPSDPVSVPSEGVNT